MEELLDLIEKEKFIKPSLLNRFRNESSICVLDVCVGMGYNSACLMEEILRSKLSLNWWGLEIDSKPLSIALEDSSYKTTWSVQILKNLMAIQTKNQWKNELGKGEII